MCTQKSNETGPEMLLVLSGMPPSPSLVFSSTHSSKLKCPYVAGGPLSQQILWSLQIFITHLYHGKGLNFIYFPSHHTELSMCIPDVLAEIKPWSPCEASTAPPSSPCSKEKLIRRKVTHSRLAGWTIKSGFKIMILTLSVNTSLQAKLSYV